MSTIKEKLLYELESWFGKDIKRITHAKKVLQLAEKIFEGEKDDITAAAHIIIPASILHDIGIKTAEEKYGSSAACYQEMEGPPAAGEILTKLGFQPADIKEITEIIGHHHSPGIVRTLNFQIVYEADWLVNLEEDYKDLPPEDKQKIIEKNFKTKTGKLLAAGRQQLPGGCF